ncbi:MAG: DUF4261 domain-containing protein [Planctomycetota bacterium]
MSNTTPRLTLIALSDSLLPSPEAVAGQLAERFPDAPSFSVTSQTESGVTFRFGEATGNYTLVEQAIPWDKIEGPCTLAWYWPEATEVMKSHTRHLFLTLVDETKDAVSRIMHLTQFTVALASTTPSIGLVWGPSVTVHKPVDFALVAAKMSRDDLPLHLWIDFRVSQRDDGALMLFTTGMDSLGHREFEVECFQGEPNALAGAVYNIAHYVIEKGPILKDGEAIGLPDGGQMNVEIGPSMIDPGMEVVKLTFEAQSA